MGSRHEPRDAEDRADDAVIDAARNRGFRIAVQCVRCKHWLTNPRSVEQHLGPHCRTKKERP